ncbi:hypothetical protein D3C80_2129940 [compost metagenome]
MFLTAKFAKGLREERKVLSRSKIKRFAKIIKPLRTLRNPFANLAVKLSSENDLPRFQIRHPFPKFPFHKAYS